MERKASAMAPSSHLGRRLRRDESAAREEPQHAVAHITLNGGEILAAQHRRFVKVHGLRLGAEYPIDEPRNDKSAGSRFGPR